MCKHAVLALFNVVSCAVVAVAQANWQQLTAVGPGKRYVAAMAYDSGRDRLVMFGGTSTLPRSWPRTDTWEFDGRRWRQMQATPPVLLGMWAEAVFDSKRGKIAVFGGQMQPHVSRPFVGNEVWEWDGASWVWHRPNLRPPNTWFHGMAYDSRRGRVVVFGGSRGVNQRYGDTWEWDGTKWLLRKPKSSPPARAHHGMTYDLHRGVVVVHGGSDSNGNRLRDTWEWDGVDWRRTLIGPAAGGTRLVYDAVRRRVVAFGGLVTRRLETWEYDGTSWSLRRTTNSISARQGICLAYDNKRGRTLMYGGGDTLASKVYGDSWSLASPNVATVTSFGRGCRSSSGVLTIGSERGLRPWIGDAVTLRSAPLPVAVPAAIGLGSSRTRWMRWRLPHPLGGLGAPGCSVHASLDAMIGVANTGAGRLRVAIPADRGLIGRRLFSQAFAFDKRANALGLVSSNGIELLFGAR